MRALFALLFITSIVLVACSRPTVETLWKADSGTAITYNKIMVAGIIPEKDDSIRKDLENHVIAQLSNRGINAVSSIEAFGSAGLARLGQEETYVTLCENGIDAVLTFALVERNKATTLQRGLLEKHTSSFYYNRIWNYHNTGQQTNATIALERPDWAWETILFDLNRLEPRVVLVSKSYDPTSSTDPIYAVTEGVIKKIIKEKIIRKEFRKDKQLKAF